MPVLFYYMDLYERIQNLPKLQYAISKGEPEAIQELKDLYYKALGKTMKRECSSCRIRAYTEITNLTNERIRIMEKQKYTFKDPETVVYFGHDHITPANLTDDIAVEMVKASAANAELFNGVFDNEPKAKAKVKADEPKAKANEKEPEVDPAKSE